MKNPHSASCKNPKCGGCGTYLQQVEAENERLREAIKPMRDWFDEQNACGYLSNEEYDMLVKVREALKEAK